MLKLTRVLGVLLVVACLVSPLASTGCYTTQVSRITHVNDIIDPEMLEIQAALPVLMVETISGSGSGVVIGGCLVLTAAHVVHTEAGVDREGVAHGEGWEPAAVFHGGYKPFLADTELIYGDTNLDLALLKIKGDQYPWSTTIALGYPRLYQRCWASGYPHGLTNVTVTDGRIEALDETGYTRYSSPTTFGNSGGAIFVMERGVLAVVSIVQRVEVEGFSAVTHLGYGATLENINRFMEAAMKSPAAVKAMGAAK